MHYPKTQPGQQCKVVAYRRIAATSFLVTNHIDLASNYHMMMLDIHTDVKNFRVYNIYNDTCTSDRDNEEAVRSSRVTHQQFLNDITMIDLDPHIPTIMGGDFNPHPWAWSPRGVRQSPWALNLEEWAIAQALDLMNPPGVPTR